MVEAINAAGGRAKFTLTPPNDGFPHNCWHAAYRDYAAMDWLLAQKRHKTSILDRLGIGSSHSLQAVT